jgi:hypothetical protein
MRIYVHDHKGVDVLDADRDHTLADVLGGPSVLWAEDHDEPLDTGATVSSLGAGAAAHVHKGNGLITVTVSYNGHQLSHSFGPGSTIERVLAWAVGSDGFKVDPATAHDLVLRLPGQPEDLDPSTHIGTLAPNGGELALDLLPSARFAG